MALSRGNRSSTQLCGNYTDSLLATDIPSPSGLCAVCEKLNYADLTTIRCCDGETKYSHFHIGFLQRIFEKDFCPGCRLISCLASSMVGFGAEDVSKSHVAIYPTSLHTVSVDETGMHTHGIEASLSIVLNAVDLGRRSSVNTSNQNGVTAGMIIRQQQDESEPHHLPRGKEMPGPHDNGRVRGLVIPPRVSIDRIRHWMAHCNTRHHAHCNGRPAPAGIKQQIRLIDVHERKVVLATLSEDFVALSYVWGPNARHILTQQSYARCSTPNGLDHITIPQTILDSMQLVGDLGKRYLWVDSACIIQDDDNDKFSQLSIMSNIYDSADIVLVAAGGQDADAGLHGLRNASPQRAWQRSELVDGIRFVTVQPGIRDVVSRTKWDSRGWTFQECAFARRALVFTDNQVYWACHEETWHEDLTSDSNPAPLMPTAADSLQYYDGNLAYGSIRKPCRTSIYCSNVSEFSKRIFTDQRDVLWAFMGVLEQLGRRFPRGFIWGLPYERLDAALLWVIPQASCSGGGHTRETKHTAVIGETRHSIAFPSWSWLSTETPVSFTDPCGSSVRSDVSWHDPIRFQSTSNGVVYQDASADALSRLGGNHTEDTSKFFPPPSLVMEYGVLDFTASTGRVRVTRKPRLKQESDSWLDPEEKEKHNNPRIVSYIHTLDGSLLGHTKVHAAYFSGSLEIIGEVALLSSNMAYKQDDVCKEVDIEDEDCGTIQHARDCKHVETRNVMLIEWEGGYARRRGLVKVDKADWDKVETKEKRIILG